MKEKRDLYRECLNDLYENATPPISLGMIIFLYGDTQEPFYEKHTITEEKYNEIVAKWKKKMSPIEKKSLDMTLLNYAPKVIYDENKR